MVHSYSWVDYQDSKWPQPNQRELVPQTRCYLMANKVLIKMHEANPRNGARCKLQGDNNLGDAIENSQ
jgi:hypothetical protein